MTWVYENVTERLDLESRYNALVSVQGETLDHLTEGRYEFGTGRGSSTTEMGGFGVTDCRRAWRADSNDAAVAAPRRTERRTDAFDALTA